MKKNQMSIISLVLNAVLLIALLVTRTELTNNENALKNQLDSVAWRLMDVQDQIMDMSLAQREANKRIADFSLIPSGVDAKTHTVSADMNVTLKQWDTDTSVTLLVTQNEQTEELPMSGSGGVFTVPVSLPVGSGMLTFEAAVTSGGETVQEYLTSYDDVAALLPLVGNNSSSISGPTYKKETLRMGLDLDSGIEKHYGAEVIDPAFQILKNGETVQTFPAKISESAHSDHANKVFYTPDSANAELELSCQPSDTVEIHLLCKDSFGLSYDFTVYTCEIGQNGTVMEREPTAKCDVEVSWKQ